MFAKQAFFILIAVVAIAIAAASIEKVNIKTVVPNSLVLVEGDLQFNELLPNYTYQRELLVSLNFTPEMLRGITSPNVTVFVTVASSHGNNSALFFEADGIRSRKASFALACVLNQGTCSRSSPISKVVTVGLVAPETGSGLNEDIVVNAVLSPSSSVNIIRDAQRVSASALKAAENFGILKRQVTELGLLEQFRDKLNSIEILIKNASLSADSLEVESARVALASAETQLEDLNKTTQQEVAKRANTASGLVAFDANNFVSWQLVAVLLIAVCILCVYIYRRNRENGKADINNLLNNR